MLALLVVACSVGLDNFGAAASIGVTASDRRGFARIVLTFGVFEGAMPVVGILLGRTAAGALGGAAHDLAGATLLAAGAYAIVAGLRAAPERRLGTSMGHAQLAVLAAVLSLDNLVIGFALGADRVPILTAAIVLGVVSAVLTWAGLELGRGLRGRLGEWSELTGGLILLGVGGAILAGL